MPNVLLIRLGNSYITKHLGEAEQPRYLRWEIKMGKNETVKSKQVGTLS